jgi:hypothetical protein
VIHNSNLAFQSFIRGCLISTNRALLQVRNSTTIRLDFYAPSLTFVSMYLHVLVCHRNAQVKFEFGYGPLIFDRVTPLELRKELKF